MSRLFAIALREYASFVRTPTGWVVTALFLLLSGVWASQTSYTPGEPASLRSFFEIARWLVLIVVPAISMKLLSEELRSGTIEPLRASPASEWEIVLGKYAGAFAFVCTMLVPTLCYPITLMLVSEPELGPMISGYAGVILLAAAYLAVGLFFSSLTDNQVVAFLATVFFFLLLFLATTVGARSLSEPAGPWLAQLSFGGRLQDFARGVIDLGDVLFFSAFAFVFVTLAVVSLEWRRWQ